MTTARAHYDRHLGPVYAWMCGDFAALAARNAAALPITTVEADLLEFRQHVATGAGVVVCMGDTLPHLASPEAVERVIRDTADVLASGGVFVATFRDYVSRELTGEARFFPVRSDGHRILTCFLEYAEDTVTVYDLLHERVDGAWRQAVSSYRKLRLDPAWLADACRRAGLVPDPPETEGGLITFVARKP
jgi:hypothetical protein